MTPFDIWAPVFRAPFSGNVVQEIEPRLFTSEIKGVPAIERRVQTEVASYGKQLGWVLEALKALSNETGTPLPKIDELLVGIEAVKATSTADLRAEAEAALARLRASDEDGWRDVVAASGR